MILKSLCFIAGFLALGTGVALGAAPQKQSFLFRLNATDQSCEQQLDQVVEKLASTPGMQVVHSACRGEVEFKTEVETFKIRSFIIEFRSKKILPSYSAIYGESNWMTAQPDDGHGVYSSYQDCISDSELQSAYFEKHTGLKALSSHCKLGAMQARSSFVLEIKSVGVPKARLFGFHSEHFTSENIGVYEKIEAMIIAAGGQPLKFGRDFLYYSKVPLPLHELSLAQFKNSEHCVQQIAEGGKIASGLNTKQKLVGCYSKVSSSGKVSFFMGIIWMGYTSHLMSDLGLMSEKYLSFEECLADLTRAKQQAQIQTPRLLGGICRESAKRDVWEIEIYGD